MRVASSFCCPTSRTTVVGNKVPPREAALREVVRLDRNAATAMSA
jgi:hypothetical protein